MGWAFWSAAKTASGESDLAKLLPYGIGFVAAAAIIFWVLKQFMSAMLTEAGKRTSGWLTQRSSGMIMLRGKKVRRYQRAVQRQYSTHPQGFGPQDGAIDIRDVYVPLQYRESGQREDLYAKIRDLRCSVVLGPAGAGKSLLLKNSMLVWAAGTPDDKRVPVLIELHRANDNGTDIFELVVQSLELCGVKRPRAFAERAVRKGRLRLLLDGLDEVGQGIRERLVTELGDFVRKHERCQAVVTCRDAVYRGQLGNAFSVVQVAEFDDSGVRRLLANWPNLDRIEADQLFDSLCENPQLMLLARRPLLLTMIAYLYVTVLSKVARNLPSSRATFYEMAIKNMVERDDRKGLGGEPLIKYRPNEKYAVLKRLAFALQDISSRGDRDRTTITDIDAMTAVNSALADVNLNPANARPILEEIIERSQLLVSIGEVKTRFAFSHLTFQEYLAALALDGKRDLLLSYYKADPDCWREVVKLWCGTSVSDCTPLVREIASMGDQQHRVLALQCLAESSEIDKAYADELISSFLTNLDAADAEVISALGAVVAAGGPRGASLAAELNKRLQGESTEVAKALSVLSASGLRSSAVVLAVLANASAAARVALREMGEIAIPALRNLAAAGHLDAVDDLAEIATPAAAMALVPLLQSEKDVAVQCAWRLAELLRDPDVEEGLRQSDSQPVQVSQEYAWIWRPFAQGEDTNLFATVSRLVELIEATADISVPTKLRELDSRIALPALGLGAVRNRARQPWSPTTEIEREIATLASSVKVPTVAAKLDGATIARILDTRGNNDPRVQTLTHSIITSALEERRYRAIAGHLTWPVKTRAIAIIGRDLSHNELRRDWTAVNNPQRRAQPWWIFIVGMIVSLFAALFTAGVLHLSARYPNLLSFSRKQSHGFDWVGLLSAAVPVIFLVFSFSSFRRDDKETSRDDKETNRPDETSNIKEIPFVVLTILILILGVIVLAILVAFLWVVTFGVFNAGHHLGWPSTLFGIALVAFAIALGCRVALRRAVQQRNPFRYCLDADDRATRNRTSVIAR